MPAERTSQTGITDIAAIQQERAVLSREIIQIHQEIFGKRRVPLEQRIGEYWNNIKGDPERLEIGIATAIDAGRNPATKMDPANVQTVLNGMVSEKLPRFFHALHSDERLRYCTRVASVLVASSLNPNLPMSQATRTVVDNMISQLDPESRVATAMAISTRANFFMQRLPMQEIKIPMGEKNTMTTRIKTPPRPEAADYVKKMDQLLQATGDELMADTENNNFSPQNLQSAIASLGFTHAEITTHITSSPSVNVLQTKAAKYLYGFVEHFRSYPNGYQDALMLTILAVQEASPQIQYELLSLLTHNYRVIYNNGESTSLNSFLRTALTADSEDLDSIFSSLFSLSSSYHQEANGGLTQLENLLIQQFVSVDLITPQEQIMLIKRFLSFATTYGIDVAYTELRDDELIDLFYGRKILYYPDHTAGSPIYLITNNEDGINAGGHVVGEIIGQQSQETNASDDAEEHPDSDSPDFIDDINNNPADTSETPNNSIPDPAHNHHDWHFFETINPLFETRKQKITTMLNSIFTEEEPSEQRLETMMQEMEEKWEQSYTGNRRKTTFSPSGNTYQLTQEAIRSVNDNSYPQITFAHQQETSINGLWTSDIYATIALEKDVTIRFVFDKNGYMILNKNDAKAIPFHHLVQLNHLLITQIHTLLVERPAREYARRAQRAKQFVNDDDVEVTTEGEIYRSRLHAARAEGAPAVVVEMYYDSNTESTVIEVPEQEIEDRLRAGETDVRVDYFMTEEQRHNAGIKISKGRTALRPGRLVYLAETIGKNRTQPHASEAARENAETNHTRVPEFVEVFSLTNDGLLTRIRLTMTYASWPSTSRKANLVGQLAS